jgi:predicted cupin superfamily sugar epimerase
MVPRAAELRAQLGLDPHPEGGWYREIFRSTAEVMPADERGLRSALTAIHFLLTKGQFSAWHVVKSDECWHFGEGDPLELLLFEPTGRVRSRIELGRSSDAQQHMAVVPAGCWQAARPLGEYSLMQCVVGPGFDFNDFALIRDSDDHRRMAEQELAGWRNFL